MCVLKEKEIFNILFQVASALDYAHRQRLYHGGIKLNNLLIGGSESEWVIYLSDFGISRVVGMGNVLTRTYQNVAEAHQISLGADKYIEAEPGKLHLLHQSFLQNYLFLAPEQKSHEESVSSPADVFAFGTLAYYLLSLKFPQGAFPLPSQFSPELTFHWDLLIKLCLHPDPTIRPKSLLEILERIQHPLVEQLPLFKLETPTVLFESKSLRPILKAQEIQRPVVDPDPTAIFRQDSQVKQYVPEAEGERACIDPLPTDMVVIPGGEFVRGSNDGNRDEMPQHEVTLKSFALDIHPVTNEQFVRFLEAMGGTKDSNHHDIIRLKDSRIKKSGGRFNIESGYIKHPVVGVTWYGAATYAKWVGKRLPTEAEWEVAAKGGNEEWRYPSGDDIEKTQVNFFSSDTTPVMSYPPNYYALFDMAGNVYEWCQDWYEYNYNTSLQEPLNPRGPMQGVYRVLRGGCWKSLKEDLRCSRRHRNNPGAVNGTYGFRCAADVE